MADYILDKLAESIQKHSKMLPDPGLLYELKLFSDVIRMRNELEILFDTAVKKWESGEADEAKAILKKKGESNKSFQSKIAVLAKLAKEGKLKDLLIRCFFVVLLYEKKVKKERIKEMMQNEHLKEVLFQNIALNRVGTILEDIKRSSEEENRIISGIRLGEDVFGPVLKKEGIYKVFEQGNLGFKSLDEILNRGYIDLIHVFSLYLESFNPFTRTHFGQSYWQTFPTGGVTSLNKDMEVDVAVIGGGITGLTAAYYLAKNKKRVAVLERSRIGSHASGKTAGLVVPGTALFPVYLIDIIGIEKTASIFHETVNSINSLAMLIRDEGIQCGFRMTNAMFILTEKHHIESLKANLQALQDINISCKVYSREEFVSAFNLQTEAIESKDPNLTHVAHEFKESGIINPTLFLSGMKQAIRRYGGQVFENSGVSRISVDNEGVVLEANNRKIKAKNVILATNLHTPNLGYLKKSITHMYSTIITTEPLSAEQLRSLRWDNSRTWTTSDPFFYYIRMTEDNRIIIGGKETLRANNRILRKTSEEIYDHLKELIGFNINIDYAWQGAIASTKTFFPFCGALDKEGKVLAAAGYNGHGIVLSYQCGKQLAENIISGNPTKNTAFSEIPPPFNIIDFAKRPIGVFMYERAGKSPFYFRIIKKIPL